MDKITKALLKLSDKEREAIVDLLKKIKKHDLAGIDLKKLKGFDDIFRARKGKVRIIFQQDDNGNVFLLKIERRNDNTYNF